MTYDHEQHHRRSIRLEGYDYSLSGAYFVTVCTQTRAELLGVIEEGAMRLSHYGEIARQCWLEIPEHFPDVELDEFVVMPDHLHGILIVRERHLVGARHAVPQQDAVPVPFGQPTPGSLPTIVRSFKSGATRGINIARGTMGATVWQRNYFEHIIRSEASLNRIRRYIYENPSSWESEREKPFSANLPP